MASTGAVSVLVPIAATLVRSIDHIYVAKFLTRDLYQLEVTSNQSEQWKLKKLPYTASIDSSLLKSLFGVRKFEEIAKLLLSLAI